MQGDCWLPASKRVCEDFGDPEHWRQQRAGRVHPLPAAPHARAQEPRPVAQHQVIRNQDGVRISSRTSIQTLFDQKFILSINNTDYDVMPPELESLSKEDLRKISDVKFLVLQLYEALNIDDYQ